jgi:hypothetical protein
VTAATGASDWRGWLDPEHVSMVRSLIERLVAMDARRGQKRTNRPGSVEDCLGDPRR